MSIELPLQPVLVFFHGAKAGFIQGTSRYTRSAPQGIRSIAAVQLIIRQGSSGVFYLQPFYKEGKPSEKGSTAVLDVGCLPVPVLKLADGKSKGHPSHRSLRIACSPRKCSAIRAM